MSFFITPTRRFFLFRACGMFVVALAMGLLPLLDQTDTFGTTFALGFAAFCLALGLLNL